MSDTDDLKELKLVILNSDELASGFYHTVDVQRHIKTLNNLIANNAEMEKDFKEIYLLLKNALHYRSECEARQIAAKYKDK